MNNNDYKSIIGTELSGKDLISNPVLNKGTAFNYEERTRFNLHGLLPPSDRDIGTMCGHMRRKERVTIWNSQYFASLTGHKRDAFYALLYRHIAEMAPIIYTLWWLHRAALIFHTFIVAPGPVFVLSVSRHDG